MNLTYDVPAVSLLLIPKQAIIDEFDWAEEAGYTLDNENFQVLYLANADANICDIDGNVLSNHKF